MQMIKTKAFTFEGKQFIVQAVKTTDGYKVYVEQNGNRVNPYSYGVDFDTALFFQQQNDDSVIDHLMKTAQSDVENRSWEEYQEAIKFLGKQ